MGGGNLVRRQETGRNVDIGRFKKKMYNISLQTVVVGYFDFNSSPQPPGYQQFYFASMRVVEHGK